jgi:2-polyprenyl-3-methyl-5-hydroxy-6-metoxy-1,4-benzoquinol methylase
VIVPLPAPVAAWHRRAVQSPRVDRVAAALARVADGPARSLLDVGCGDGEIGEALARRLGVSLLAGVDLASPAPRPPWSTAFDGRRLPFGDGAFDVVALADVLHHAERPVELLREALRVASRRVLIKDHLARGLASRGLLLAMDLVGNAASGVAVTGRYFDPAALRELVKAAGGVLVATAWPVDVHDPALRRLAPSELQVAVAVARRGSRG